MAMVTVASLVGPLGEAPGVTCVHPETSSSATSVRAEMGCLFLMFFPLGERSDLTRVAFAHAAIRKVV
jgi:hypothetical protein